MLGSQVLPSDIIDPPTSGLGPWTVAKQALLAQGSSSSPNPNYVVGDGISISQVAKQRHREFK